MTFTDPLHCILGPVVLVTYSVCVNQVVNMSLQQCHLDTLLYIVHLAIKGILISIETNVFKANLSLDLTFQSYLCTRKHLASLLSHFMHILFGN